MRYTPTDLTADEPRAILYIRVSTEKQAEHGHSLYAQQERLTAYAAKQGMSVVEIVIDGGESASSLDRPGLQRALAMIGAGDANLLVATKGDRISRNLRDLLNLAATLAESKASIATADGTFDTSTPVGKAMTQMQGVFAELERELIAQRTREGMAAARSKGVRLGRPLVGLRVEDGQLVVADLERIALGRRAAAMHANGMSLRAIAAAFDQAGMVPPRGGRRWYAPAVSRLIRAAEVADELAH